MEGSLSLYANEYHKNEEHVFRAKWNNADRSADDGIKGEMNWTRLFLYSVSLLYN